MTFRLLAAFLGSLLLIGCVYYLYPDRDGPEPPVEPVLVLAATSLTEPFTVMGQLWEQQEPGQPVEFSFASSHYLVQQLILGAPGDLLALADQVQIDKAIEAGVIKARDVTPLAHNALALAVHPRSEFAIASLQDLAQSGVRLAWARPGVPLASYTAQLLAVSEWGLTETEKRQIAANVLSYEANASSVRNRLLQGEVDAAILYVSDALAVQDRLNVIWLDPSLNVRAELYIAPVSSSPRRQLSQDFMELVLSEQGQDVLKQYGFGVYGSE